MKLQVFCSLAFFASFCSRSQGQIGVSVFKTTETPAATELFPVTFDTVLFNEGTNFNESEGIFTVPSTGVYFLSYGAGAPPGMQLSYQLMTGRWPSFSIVNNVYKTNIITDGPDAGSRASAGYTVSGEQYAMAVPDTSSMQLYSNCNFGVTFMNVLRLEDDVPVFSVARTDLLFGFQEPLPFSTTLLNVFTQWNPVTDQMEVTLPGLYFLSLSAGTISEVPVDLAVLHNSDIAFELTRTSRLHAGVDTISRSGMLRLAANDVVQVSQNAGAGVWADGLYQTSLTGFMVASSAQLNWPAFFVGRTTSWSGTETLAPVTFDRVVENNDGLFDPADSKMKVTRSGVYYISISSGLQPGTQALTTLRLNGLFIAAVYRWSTLHNGVDTLSRDVILRLTAGDVLHVEADPNSALYSDADGLQTSFLAFMLPVPQ